MRTHAPSYSRQIFCDFGKSFVVTDLNGEEPISAIISSITRVSVLCKHHCVPIVRAPTALSSTLFPRDR